MHLFVYGTLKRGEPRHRFLAEQKFIAAVQTLPLYRLYNLGDYPGLVECPDGRAIEGELWDVADVCLTQLDQVEGCAEGLYRRGQIELAPPQAAVPAVAYFYEQSVSGLADCGSRW